MTDQQWNRLVALLIMYFSLIFVEVGIGVLMILQALKDMKK